MNALIIHMSFIRLEMFYMYAIMNKVIGNVNIKI
jgi:hypothetical protein